MIDRKALWTTALFILAMTAAALWRISLLPDWHHMTVGGLAGKRTVSTLPLFISPLCLVFVLAVLFARKWLVSGPPEAFRPWWRWGAFFLIPYALIVSLMQAYIIGRSFGVGVPLSQAEVARIIFVSLGGLIVVLGNSIPKLPLLSARFGFWRLEPWQTAQHQRFVGKIMFVIGIAIVVGGTLLPMGTIRPGLLYIWLFSMALSFWHRMKLRHGLSPSH